MQADFKSSLAFASLTQAGLIVAEVGVGGLFGPIWLYVPLVHLLGHACLRTLQLLRAPNVLHDRHQLENALGDAPHAPPAGAADGAKALRRYRFAFLRGGLDDGLDRWIAAPFVRALRWCDERERGFAQTLNGVAPTETDEARP